MWGQYCDIESFQGYDMICSELDPNDVFDLVDNRYDNVELNLEDDWELRAIEMLDYTASRVIVSIIFGTLILAI